MTKNQNNKKRDTKFKSTADVGNIDPTRRLSSKAADAAAHS